MNLFSFSHMGDIFIEYHSLFISGILMTLLLSVITVTLGTVLGTLTALARISRWEPFSRLGRWKLLLRISRWNPLSALATVYIEVFRATPLMVQVMIIYFGAAAFGLRVNLFPQLFSDFNCYFWGIICLVLNSGAYVAEIVRSGINAVEIGQEEAARALGMSHWMCMRLVVLPQAVRNILPALMNEFVAIIKETSIVSLVGINEIMFRAKDVIAISYRTLEPYVIAGIAYFLIVFPLSKLVLYLERRLNASVKR